MSDKHLTDAECAAEYWRAMWDLAILIAADAGYNATGPERQRRAVIAWGEVANRFASTPHAHD